MQQGAVAAPPPAGLPLRQTPLPPVMTGAPTQVAPQVVGLPPGYVLVQQDREPSPLKAKFDSQPKKLACFLTEVWNYLEWYETMHPDEPSRVNAVTSNLEGDTTE